MKAANPQTAASNVLPTCTNAPTFCRPGADVAAAPAAVGSPVIGALTTTTDVDVCTWPFGKVV